MKKHLSWLLLACFCLSMSACTTQKTPQAEAPTPAPTIQVAEPMEETPPIQEPVTMENPMDETTPQALLENMGINLAFMAEYENARFYHYTTDLPIAEVQFRYNGKDYSYRVAMPNEETDISGMNYQAPETSQEAVDYNTATLRLSNGQGDIGWYDFAPGIQYNLSCRNAAVGEELVALANRLYSPVQGNVEGDITGFMQDSLSAIQQGYFPGSAGSSLVGATYAAQLADLFTGVRPSAENVAQEVHTFAATLSVEDRILFATQLFGVKNSFQELATNGIGILETAGATAVLYPWDNATLSTLFSSMVLSGSEYAYAQKLSAYVTAMEEHASPETLIQDGMNYMIIDQTLDSVGYCLEDLDNNGVKELLLCVISQDDFYHGLVLELCTMDDFGFSTQVFMSGERDRLYTMGGDSFFHHGASSAADSSDTVEQYENGALSVIRQGEGSVQGLSLTPLSKLA